MATRKVLLKINAFFLMGVGGAQVIFELLSHFLGIGPLAGRFTASPYTLGFFEAHGLAVLIGALMFTVSRAAPDRAWHLLGASVHLLLGGANLLFWDSFIKLDFVAPGVVATVFHGLFLLAHTYWYLRVRADA